jgi:hypothetical protein
MRNLLFASVLLLTALALFVQPAHAVLCCDSTQTSTPTEVGTGSTCAEAQADLAARLDADITARCGGRDDCRNGIVYTDDCYDNPGGGLASSGWEAFGCVYRCGPPPP